MHVLIEILPAFFTPTTKRPFSNYQRNTRGTVTFIKIQDIHHRMPART